MNENVTQPASTEQPAPLDVSVKITPSKEDGNLLAFANVTLGGCFAVRGIRVVNSEKGVFVAMPDRQNNQGEHFDVYAIFTHPVTRFFRMIPQQIFKWNGGIQNGHDFDGQDPAQ